MTFLDDFKKFALRGNMIDLAIGFTVGAAFTTVVKSLVNDIIMPPIGLLTGNADFSDLFWVIHLPDGVDEPQGGFQTLQDAQDVGVVTMNYGVFLNTCLALLIVALAMFVIIRMVNRLDEQLDEAFGEPKPDSEPADKKCDFCRSTIPFRATRCPQCTSELVVPNISVDNKPTVRPTV
ncbi:large conductance mechanosensitive channel protein MscL [Allorhodopirellula heiligendammensis]|uniref:Large-conductance mechanosensitive channel n=1 Tax=Allorhodopirellula heiligendammensis TaxID=2714739 RepID=A0A5C6BU57_9BACT|nr:large conductance mechanosensitive channel protein MscL [Allorhodopirellula heiligendammensis]TWU15568.1 Large-conductance mechanosensitive channel [Allorhodopirellula heiligendammensis]